MQKDPESVLNTWFYEVGPDKWFDRSATLGALLKERFEDLYTAARQGDLKAWKETPEGTLALLLLLDLFPRRMFAGTAKAYETDELARDIAREGIIRHFDDRIDKTYKLLFYLPFSHSESLSDQRLAIFYIRERTKEEAWLQIAEDRCYTIEHFNRFPQRNEILGRETTPEEKLYLATTPAYET